jgi:hypothetical protein
MVSTAGPASIDSPIAAAATPSTLQLITDAVGAGRQLCGRRSGRPLRLWPHALGMRAGAPYVLGFILEAGEQGVSRWEWIPVAEVEAPWSQEGIWIGSPRAYRPSTGFLDVVLAECDD